MEEVTGYLISPELRKRLIHYVEFWSNGREVHPLVSELEAAKVVCNQPFHQHSDNNPPSEECL